MGPLTLEEVRDPSRSPCTPSWFHGPQEMQVRSYSWEQPVLTASLTECPDHSVPSRDPAIYTHQLCQAVAPLLASSRLLVWVFLIPSPSVVPLSHGISWSTSPTIPSRRKRKPHEECWWPWCLYPFPFPLKSANTASVTTVCWLLGCLQGGVHPALVPCLYIPDLLILICLSSLLCCLSWSFDFLQAFWRAWDECRHGLTPEQNFHLAWNKFRQLAPTICNNLCLHQIVFSPYALFFSSFINRLNSRSPRTKPPQASLETSHKCGQWPFTLLF